MERLTEKCWRNLDPWECCGQDKYCQRGCHDEGGCTNGCKVPKMYCKLAKYEDAEEQGLLLRLPCKVGDTVYKLWYKPCHNGEDCPDSYSCCGCEDECDLKKDIFEITVPNLDWILQHMKHFGDGVWFLTREEAEAALAEKGGAE